MLVPSSADRHAVSRRVLVCLGTLLGFVLVVLRIQLTPWAVLPAERNATLAGLACGMAFGLACFGWPLLRAARRR